MTRKLSMLIVVVAAVSAVSLLQAQDCQCPASKKTNSGSCEFCVAAANYEAGVAATCTDEGCQNCPSCVSAACPACPACAVQSACLDTHINAACAATAGLPSQSLTGAFAKLPGATSFIQEQSAECANQREQLAIQLAEYLASGKHEPAHIRQVLHMALESAADMAHRQAMSQHIPPNQPLAAGKARPLNQDEPSAYYHKDDIQYFPKEPEFHFSSHGTTNQPTEPVIDEERQTAMDLRQLQRDQETMQDMIGMIQKDMQRIAQDLSQLHVESRMQAPQPAATGFDRNSSRNTWRSVPNPSFQSQPASTTNTQSSQMEYIELLKREVEMLRQQLHQTRNQTNFQTRTNQVRQADFQQTRRLQPRHTPTMALTPAATASVTVNYYVGDLMEPPFHTATLRLMQFIKANVDPDSWSDSHMMQITEPSISLAITQSRANHDQIAELLRQVRIGARSYMARPMRR